MEHNINSREKGHVESCMVDMRSICSCSCWLIFVDIEFLCIIALHWFIQSPLFQAALLIYDNVLQCYTRYFYNYFPVKYLKSFLSFLFLCKGLLNSRKEWFPPPSVLIPRRLPRVWDDRWWRWRWWGRRRGCRSWCPSLTISISSSLPYSGHPEKPPNHSKPDCTSFTGTSYTHLK